MNIYLSEYIHPDALALLKKNATVVDNFDQPEALDAIIFRGATVRVTRDIIERGKNLKVISKHGVGFNYMDLDAAKEMKIPVIYTPGTNILSVAELLVGMILDISRKISYANMGLRKGTIKGIATVVGSEITGKTLGLIGMGNISLLLAEILQKGFRADVVGYDPYVSRAAAEGHRIRKLETMEDVLKCSDIVNISVPLTDSTRNMLSGSLFDHFKPSAVFVNASRGGVVNEDDLYNALVTKKLQAAASDVFLEEPIGPDNRFLQLENFCATPHIGGSTEEALFRTGMEVVEETLHVLKGKAPKHPVY